MSKFFVAVFYLSLLPTLLFAEGVKIALKNGDRLSGELISEGEDEIRLKVDYLGEIALDRSMVARVERVGAKSLSDESVVSEVAKQVESSNAGGESREVAAGGVPPASGVKAGADLSSSDSEGKDTVADAKPGRTGAFSGLLDILAAWEEEFNPMPKWKKNLQFGFNSTTGRRDLSTLNYRLDMSRKIEKSRLKFNADYAYGEANGVTNLDKFSTKFRWRKDISPGVFYEAQSLYSRDSIKLIDSNIEQKVGLGTRLLDSEGSTLSAGVGAVGRWREINQRGTQSDALINVFQDWEYKLTEKVSLKQDFKFAMPTDETDDYEIDFAASVRSNVTESINLSVQLQLGFDNSLPEDRREDRRLISSLGYSF